MKIKIINGPNLNMLEYRESHIYGSKKLEDINFEIEKHCINDALRVDFFQSNFEGEIINEIHKCIVEDYDAIIINPGAFSHYSYAIYDALLMFKKKKIEVHLSDVDSRDLFRKNLITANACDCMIKGKGYKGYIEAIDMVKTKN